MKSGVVSIVGRPNVGKSTLLNNLLEMKIAITSNKAGTTRNNIQGIYNNDDCQIIFVDTPGIHKPINKFGNMLNNKAYSVVDNVDLILFLIDASTRFGKGDLFILNKLKEQNIPVILLLNKVDLIRKDSLLFMIDELNKLHSFCEIIPVSAYKNINIDDLMKTIKKYLPYEEVLVDSDMVTNISTNFYVSEIVREKIFRFTEKEVPHSVTCLVEEIEYEEKRVNIRVLIIVDRSSLKKIILGRRGEMIKNIGKAARHDLEEYFNKKVYLETFVKVIDNWKENDKYLQEFGLKEEI